MPSHASAPLAAIRPSPRPDPHDRSDARLLVRPQSRPGVGGYLISRVPAVPNPLVYLLQPRASAKAATEDKRPCLFQCTPKLELSNTNLSPTHPTVLPPQLPADDHFSVWSSHGRQGQCSGGRDPPHPPAAEEASPHVPSLRQGVQAGRASETPCAQAWVYPGPE